MTLVLLTLANGVAFAAPSSVVSPQELNKGAPTPTTLPAPSFDSDSTAITPVGFPPAGASADQIRISRVVRDDYWSVAFGEIVGRLDLNEPADSTQLLSLNYGMSQPHEAAFEAGLDLSMKSHLGFHWQFKKYCCLGSYKEPYWTLGAAALYPSNDFLGRLPEPSSYQIQAGVGFEDLIGHQRQWRTEFLLGENTLGTLVLIRLGYVLDDRTTAWMARFLNF